MRYVSGLSLPDGNQWISQEDHGHRSRPGLCDEVASDPSPHRLSDHDDSINPLRQPFERRRVALDQAVETIGSPPVCLHVRIVERKRRKPGSAPPPPQPFHERMALATPGSMGEEKPHLPLPRTGQQRGDLGARRPFDTKTAGHEGNGNGRGVGSALERLGVGGPPTKSLRLLTPPPGESGSCYD